MLRSAAVLAWVLAIEPGSVRIEADQVDAVAVEEGLRLRLGSALEGWDIEVKGARVVSEVEARLRAPDGTFATRSVVLSGNSREGRSRELAAALALLVEQHQDTQPEVDPDPAEPEHAGPKTVEPKLVEPSPPPANRPPHTRGPAAWMAVGPHVELGPPDAVDPSFGVDLRAGGWVLRDVVQPVITVGWFESRSRDLALDGVRFGAGVHLGGSIARERLWLGVGALGSAMWVTARDRNRPSTWVAHTEIPVLLQYRGPGALVLGLRSGVALVLPPVRAIGVGATLRWGEARWMVAVSVGIRLPPRR